MLLVGIVRRPHGLSGEVSIEVATDFPRRFVPGVKLTWQRGDESRELEIASARRHGDRMLLSFSGIEGLDAARGLGEGELLVREDQAFRPSPGFYFSHEIEGFRCEDREGHLLGVARGLEQTVAGPLLTVETPQGREALVPFVEEMVREIDRGASRIVLELPEGLLDL